MTGLECALPPISCIGLSYRKAPLSIREHYRLPAAELRRALLCLHNTFKEALLLSTCNRTEIYLTPIPHQPIDLLPLLSEIFHTPLPLLISHLPYFYQLNGGEAMEHLFSVASGLDSQVLGESEVLRQVKESYAAALSVKTTGSLLNKLFQSATACGKKVRTKTQLSSGATSFPAIALTLAKKNLGRLAQKSVLVIGAGKIAESALLSLRKERPAQLFVTNRSLPRAKSLAQTLQACAENLAALEKILPQVDLIFSSTSAPHPILTLPLMQQARSFNSRPLCIFDFAIPRDVEEEVRHLPGVSLYNLDDFQAIAQKNTLARSQEIAQAKKLVQREMERFLHWHKQTPTTLTRGQEGIKVQQSTSVVR